MWNRSVNTLLWNLVIETGLLWEPELQVRNKHNFTLLHFCYRILLFTVIIVSILGALAIWAKSLNTWDLSFALAFNPSVHLNGQVSGNTLIESPKLQHTLVVFDKPPSEGVKDVVEKTGCEEFVLEREECKSI